MAEQVLKDQALWFGGYDYTGVMNALGLDYGAEMVDVTVFGDQSRGRAGGLKNVAVSHQGLWDGTGVLDQELFDRMGLAAAPMSFAMVDAAEGDVAYSFLAALGEYAPGGAVGDALAFSVSAEGAGDLVRGTLMHNATRGATGNGTGRQIDAVAAGQKLYGALHVLSASGTAPTLDVTVESDDNAGFTSAVTQFTFAQQTAVGFEWAAPVDGPITDDWWRLVYTIGGAGPSFQFVGILGIQ